MNLMLKIFYGKKNEKCQNVYIDTSKVIDFRTLVTVIRQKISYLNFITDTDLRIEYEDDEGTFVRLDDTDPDAFFDAQRCAKVVQGTDSRRLKLRVSESSTPQRKLQKLSYSPDAMCTRSVSENNVSLDDAASSNPSRSSSTTSSSFSRPVRKYLNFAARATSSTNYTSPLERYLKDAEMQVSVQTDLVKKAQNNIDEFNSSIPNIDKRSPSCSLCHRRENHNRVNCPYKPYKCESAFTCGDLEKHKDEKDQLKQLQQELNTEKQKLKKLELQLKSKKESQTKTVISFNSQMRNRLVESNHAKYLSKEGKEKWRVINMDLSLLDQHFKGKVPDDDTDLQEALEYISMHRLPGSKHCDQVKELWKRKGLKWPGSVVASEVPMPVDEEEENEQFQMALKESLEKQHIDEVVSNCASKPDANDEPDSPLATNDTEAAFILMDLMNTFPTHD